MSGGRRLESKRRDLIANISKKDVGEDDIELVDEDDADMKVGDFIEIDEEGDVLIAEIMDIAKDDAVDKPYLVEFADGSQESYTKGDLKKLEIKAHRQGLRKLICFWGCDDRRRRYVPPPPPPPVCPSGTVER